MALTQDDKDWIEERLRIYRDSICDLTIAMRTAAKLFPYVESLMERLQTLEDRANGKA